MQLLVDAGNTRIKWALIEADALATQTLGHWSAFGSVQRADISQLGEAWRTVNISRVLLSNVAGAEMRECLEQMTSRAFGLKPVPLSWFASVPELAGVRNGYRDPAQLGCDRFAAAIGAHALFPNQNLLIVSCGTATTVDAVTADGLFVGGMILPGLATMASSLARTTQLPQVPQQLETLQLFADNTADAIASGCLAAQVGAIERALAAHHKNTGAVHCLLSGGAAAMIAPHLTVPCQMVDNLVLTGLQAVATDLHKS